MAKIQAPKWCKHAIPTGRGWEDPQTGELYVSGRFNQQQIDEFYGLTETPVEEPVVLTEAPISNKSLDDMTKAELIALGEQYGMELSMSQSKSEILAELGPVDRV